MQAVHPPYYIMIAKLFPLLSILLVATFSPTTVWANNTEVSGRIHTRIATRFHKIKEIDYQFSLGRIPAHHAALKITKQLKHLNRLQQRLLTNDPLRQALSIFLTKWQHSQDVEHSLLDNNQEFMSQVTAFYLRGFIPLQKTSRTLFPLFRP